MVTNQDWSKLCPDVLRKIFETLESPVDSHRAKTVCSDWYSVWKTWENSRPPCPMQIIHLGDSSIEEGTRKHVGLFKKCYCMASSGNWLLMVDRPLKFFIWNLLTWETINLPLMESSILDEQVIFEPGSERSSYGRFDDSAAVLWINEKTMDYVVSWSLRERYLFFLKKGDDSWCNLNLNENNLGFRDVVLCRDFKKSGKNLGVLDMACEKGKLYLFTNDQQIMIIDISREIPREEITENPYRNHPFDFVEKECEYIWKRKIAIRKSGEVLIILSLKEVMNDENRLLFYIFKMNFESFKWERVYSIGDEMVVFGHGITIGLALKDLGVGIKSDSIYFVDDDVWEDHRVSNGGVFDIATSRIEWPKKVCYKINSTQWCVPGVAY